MLLSYEESILFLQRLPEESAEKGETLHFLPKKLLIEATQAGKKVWHFRPPLLFPRMAEDETLAHYLTQISEDLPAYLLLLLRANGNAALGYAENGKLLNHKVIRKYMVRQKQGKSQLKHLKTSGKSRMGSRIRLQQTIEFGEEINQKLWDWETENAERILVSSSIDVWNLLFKVEPLPPFEKRDKRLRKVPYHVQNPTHTELKRIARLVTFGHLHQAKS